MSIDIRYFTNGAKALYCVTDSGVTPIQRDTYTKIEDIPANIRHYAPHGDPQFITPDIAQCFGFGGEFYPEYEKKCGYRGDGFIACIGRECKVADTKSPRMCPYWEKLKEADTDA